MKSIEALEYLDDIAHGRIMDYDPHELKLIVEKDLEVLEILKKYLYLGGFDGDEDYPRDLRLEICDYSHLIDKVEEEYADYNKVKQWLETNKEGDYND